MKEGESGGGFSFSSSCAPSPPFRAAQIDRLPESSPPEALILLLGPAAAPLDHAVFAPGPPIGRVVTRSLPTAPGAPPAPPRAASARLAGTAVVVTGSDPPPEQAAAWLQALLAAVPAERVVAVGSIPAREYGGEDDPSERCVVHAVVDSKAVLERVAKRAGVKEAAFYKHLMGRRLGKEAAKREKKERKDKEREEEKKKKKKDKDHEEGENAPGASAATEASAAPGASAATPAPVAPSSPPNAASPSPASSSPSPSLSPSPARSPSPLAPPDPSLSACPPPLPPGTLVSGTAAVAARLPEGAAVLAVLATPTPDRSLAAALARAVEVFVPEGALKQGGTEVRAALAASAADAMQRVSDLAGMYA